MISGSQFKRTMPIIPKISARSIGHDFRYLRDWEPVREPALRRLYRLAVLAALPSCCFAS
jgi:hypothetical protein